MDDGSDEVLTVSPGVLTVSYEFDTNSYKELLHEAEGKRKVPVHDHNLSDHAFVRTSVILSRSKLSTSFCV